MTTDTELKAIADNLRDLAVPRGPLARRQLVDLAEKIENLSEQNAIVLSDRSLAKLLRQRFPGNLGNTCDGVTCLLRDHPAWTPKVGDVVMLSGSGNQWRVMAKSAEATGFDWIIERVDQLRRVRTVELREL